ncbi:MerR family transcriptional regulator [Cellulomonas chitinilytica]|uniref:MerR family transcriptional regulator n=1 Tax=Cellulomonas chitinilytica TaxID=398759 RepID=A0A919P0X8_9CELL|nr:MerR family transcriptional regulator [Cellulomonas chitinilytica]GIG19636.1 MerR family transcriptional regulator [Cellulomonas chitinilytica]
MPSDADLTIGEFARRSGLSLKALRLYDARGILPPERVDPGNGYRYYGAGQLDRARTIALLRRLDMPLALVGELLDGPEDRLAGTVRTWWADRRRELDDRGPAVDLVVRTLATAADAPSRAGTTAVTGFTGADVVVERAPARRVATLRRHVSQPELVASFTADVLTLRRHLADAGASTGAEFWVLFHGAVGPDGDGPVETCVPYEGHADPAGPVVLREEPAHLLASVPVTAQDCRYPQIIGAYLALEGWFADHRLDGAGPVRELYPVPWSDEGVVAHVAQPLPDGADLIP